MATPHYVVKKVGDKYIPNRVPDEQSERALYLFGGAALTVFGMFKGGLKGTICALTGGGMLYYVATGENPLNWLESLSTDRAPTGNPKDAPSYHHDYQARRKSPQLPADEVDEQAMESFPASDPPASSVRAE